MIATEIRFEDHVGLVHFQAKRGYRWAQRAGVALDYEDMYQEASVAFLLAARGFDPQRGLQFSTYYTQVAFSEFRRSIGWMTGVKNLNAQQRAEIAARAAENSRRAQLAEAPLADLHYGLAPLSLSSVRQHDDAGDDDLAATIAGGDDPQDALEARQQVELALSQLSPLARLVADWLGDPPAPLLREVGCQRAHAEHCTAHGQRTRGLREGVTVPVILDFLRLVGGVPGAALRRAERELQGALGQLEALL